MSLVLPNRHLKWLGPRIPEGATMLKNMFLLLFKEKDFFLSCSGLSPGSALFMVASSPMGIPLAAVNGDVVPSLTTIY